MNKKLRDSLALRMISLAMCAVLLCTSLCGCAAFASRVEKNGTAPYETPELCGVWGANSINKQLNAYISPIIEALAKGNSQGVVASLDYALSETDSGFELSVWLEGSNGQKLELSNIEIADGSASLEPFYYTDILSDPVLLAQIMEARKIGAGVTLNTLDAAMTEHDMVEFLLGWYEQTTGHQIDYSGLTNTSTSDITLLKYLALAPSSEYAGQIPLGNSDNIGTYYTFISLMETFMQETAFRAYGMSSRGVSLSDLVDTVELFLGTFTPRVEAQVLSESDISADVDNADWYVLLSNADIRNTVAADLMASDEYITRKQAASELVAMLKGFYTPKSSDLAAGLNSWEYGRTTRYAVGLGLIDYYPSYGEFESNTKVYEYELFDLAENLASSAVMHWAERQSGIWNQNVTWRDALGALDKMNNYFADKTAVQYTLCDNSRDYDWYMAQHDTGKYSSINCMPAMTAMGLLWQNADSTATVEELRNKYLSDNRGGWYFYNVKTALEDAGATYNIHDTDYALILEDLDRGGIVLTQFSEAAQGQSGHCGIIYGYEKAGESVRFLVHDSDVASGLRPDAKHMGEALHIDSSYMMWTINRFTDTCFALPDTSSVTSPSDIAEG